MPNAVLIDYGCHSFTYRLAVRLRDQGFPVSYYVNGSLESPNLSSVASWQSENPSLVHTIVNRCPYGKVSLIERLKGEREWADHCVAALEQKKPAMVIASCVPLAALSRIQAWARNRKIPFVYWLQDLQGRAMHDLLGRKFGAPGKLLGSLATVWEQRALRRSQMVITIAPHHEKHLPRQIREASRFALLENWANIEEFPALSPDNSWARRHGLSETLNVVYSGTLGLKHDLPMFYALAKALKSRPDARLVVVSSGQAANLVREEASRRRLTNLILLPFQPYSEVPRVLASAAVLIAPLDRSAGAFCVPSKVLSYLCAGRPTVMAIDSDNASARMLERAQAGIVVAPGDQSEFIASVMSLLDQPELRLRLGIAGRAYAESAFNLDSVAAKFLTILDAASENSFEGVPVRKLVNRAAG